MKVRYEFTVIAGKGGSSVESIAKAADEAARTFFGDSKFELDVTVRGKPSDYYIECAATGEVKP